MAITKIWVSQDCDDVQALRIGSSSRYIHMVESSWQPLFSQIAELTAPIKSLKLAAEFDTSSFSKLRIAGYLYNETTASVDAISSMTFRLHKVTQPNWVDVFEIEVSGIELLNSYFFAEVDLSSITGNFNGDTTLMVEGVATRLSTTYRNRIYVNHLGIYGSHVRLKKFVDFLDVTKLDE